MLHNVIKHILQAQAQSTSIAICIVQIVYVWALTDEFATAQGYQNEEMLKANCILY